MPYPLLLLLAFVLVSRTAAVAAEPRDLAAELDGLRAKYHLPGCACAVVVEGRITAIGVSRVRRADRADRVTTADLWLLGSCTKSLTATLAGVLVDQGKLRWDMPIPEALPGVACGAGWRGVTVWDLVTHESGIGQIWMPETGFFSGVLSPREQREGFARSILSRDPANPPGKFAYSNAGYAVLAAILEHAGGMGYEEMLGKFIFAPLALASAGVGPVANPANTAEPWGHRQEGNRWVPVAPPRDGNYSPLLVPAAGVHMSLADFAAYATWLSTGEPRLVKEETFRKLQTPPAGSTYSGGLWKSELPGIGGEAVCHTGTIGGSFAVFYAGRNCACVTVFNTEGIGWEWLGDEITAEVLKAVGQGR